MEGLLDSQGLHKVDLVGTRWRHSDVYGMMLGDENLRRQIRLYNRAILEDQFGKPDRDEGQPIWKENKRYGDVAWVRDLEVRAGSFRFWSNYMNSPVPKGSAVFNMEDIDIRYMDAVGEGSNAYAKLPEVHPDGRRINYHFYTAVDPNTQESTAHDPAVVLTVAIDDMGHFWGVKMDRGHPNQSVLIDWILNHHKLFQSKIISIEAIAYQTTLAYWLKQACVEKGIYLPIREIKKRTASKYARIVTLQGMTEARKLHGPNWAMFKPLWDEMTIYTEAAKRDDCLDCLADIATFGKVPDPSAIAKTEKVKSPVTMDRILGRIRAQRETIVERDDSFARRGVPVTHAEAVHHGRVALPLGVRRDLEDAGKPLHLGRQGARDDLRRLVQRHRLGALDHVPHARRVDLEQFHQPVEPDPHPSHRVPPAGRLAR